MIVVKCRTIRRRQRNRSLAACNDDVLVVGTGPVTELDAVGFEENPAISADERTITFGTDRAGGQAEIFIARHDGCGSSSVTALST